MSDYDVYPVSEGIIVHLIIYQLIYTEAQIGKYEAMTYAVYSIFT